jgi:hypothetical protein
MGPLDNPMTRLRTRAALERLGLFASGSNVGREPELLQQFTSLVVVVPLLSRHIPCGFFVVGLGRLTGMLSIVS